LIRNVHGSQDHVDHGNDRSGLTGTGETPSGLRRVARNQDVVVLAPEARRSIADGGIYGKKMTVNTGSENQEGKGKKEGSRMCTMLPGVRRWAWFGQRRTRAARIEEEARRPAWRIGDTAHELLSPILIPRTEMERTTTRIFWCPRLVEGQPGAAAPW
jgi:hypothetical protein